MYGKDEDLFSAFDALSPESQQVIRDVVNNPPRFLGSGQFQPQETRPSVGQNAFLGSGMFQGGRMGVYPPPSGRSVPGDSSEDAVLILPEFPDTLRVPGQRPTKPTLREGVYNFQEPARLSDLQMPEIPTRDYGREARRFGPQAAMLALGGALLGGTPGALAAVGSGLRGYQQGADDAFGDALARSAREADRVMLQHRADQDYLGGLNEMERARFLADQAHNQNLLTGYKTEVSAWDAEQDRIAAEKKAGEVAAATKLQRRESVLKRLSELDEASQQKYLANLDAAGVLTELNIPARKDANGVYDLSLHQAARPKAADSPEAIKRKQLEAELKQQYRVLADDRLKPEAEQKTLKRINEIQAALGYGTGEEGLPETIFEGMTAYQKEVIAARKRQLTETERSNREKEKDADADRGIAAGNLDARLRSMDASERRMWLEAEERNIKSNRERNLEAYNTGEIDEAEYTKRERNIDARAKRSRDAVTKAGAPPASETSGATAVPGGGSRVTVDGKTYTIKPKGKGKK